MNQSASIVGATVSNFGFTTKRNDELTASEYTLADLEIDLSPSTAAFRAELEKALATVVDSLAKSPRSENMLVRVQAFDENLHEIHGFINLSDIKAGDYDLDCHGGGTALFDAALCGVEAVAAYGKHLDELEYAVNAVVFIVTDGQNNSSRKARDPKKVGAAINKAKKAENLESIKTVLIGVGDEQDTRTYLEDFQKEAGIDQFVWVGKATANSIAKLANFISKSVSSASQSLGTGGPSANLTF